MLYSPALKLGRVSVPSHWALAPESSVRRLVFSNTTSLLLPLLDVKRTTILRGLMGRAQPWLLSFNAHFRLPDALAWLLIWNWLSSMR